MRPSQPQNSELSIARVAPVGRTKPTGVATRQEGKLTTSRDCATPVVRTQATEATQRAPALRLSLRYGWHAQSEAMGVGSRVPQPLPSRWSGRATRPRMPRERRDKYQPNSRAAHVACNRLSGVTSVRFVLCFSSLGASWMKRVLHYPIGICFATESQIDRLSETYFVDEVTE